MKKRIILLIGILVVTAGATVAGLWGIKQIPKSSTSEPQVEKSMAEELYEVLKNENISKEFLEFVDGRDANALEKMKDLVEKEGYDKTQWHEVTGYSWIVLNDLFLNNYKEAKNVTETNTTGDVTLSFTGDVSLADNWHIAPKYDARGGVKGILGENVLKMMTETDLMVVNSEFTVSNRGSALKGKMYTFRAKPERLKIYGEMGVDLVSLANNHVYDYGEQAFLDMLDAFDEYEIPHVGAGRNIKEASEAYYFILNGYKFAFIGATRAEKNIYTAGATEKQAGVFRCYDPTGVINKIKEIRDNADYVIPMIHFGRENSHSLEKEQVSSAKAYIDAGADMVVGHHAHTLQGVEIYKDKPIIYNLGNFLFNNVDTETALFQVKMANDGTMEYYLYPALQKNEKTELLTGKQKQKVIDDINSWSINAKLNSDGKIEKK